MALRRLALILAFPVSQVGKKVFQRFGGGLKAFRYLDHSLVGQDLLERERQSGNYLRIHGSTVPLGLAGNCVPHTRR